MAKVTLFLVFLFTSRSSAQGNEIYTWEDDYTSQITPTKPPKQPVVIGTDSTNIYPWEDDFTLPEITTQPPQSSSTVIVNSTNLYPWEDSVPGFSSAPSSTTPPTWTNATTSVIYPWEDDYVPGGLQSGTKPPSTNNPTTTFWTQEPTASSRPPWTTTTPRTTIDDLFQNPIFWITTKVPNRDPCRGLGIIRQLICLTRNLNPSIGIALSSGFGKK